MQYYNKLKEEHPKIYSILEKEIDRQSTGLELIPSENYVSRAVLEALQVWKMFWNNFGVSNPLA
jgi:glycine/serine hydroxymethyltransferase